MAAKSFCTKTNVKRAFDWLKSNPDRAIKNGYGMRNVYRDFSIVEDDFLKEVVSELKNGTYIPSLSCKVYLPKPSGGLRPYTILTVKDQVVYQALVNIIAEQFPSKIKNRYYKKVFGNLYAGKESVWFYKKWKDGYKKFNNAARKAFENGQVFMASFDLVACYDSIDHKVLKYYLEDIHVSKDAIDILLNCLSKWTSTDHKECIYQGHGIPQGPMSSGLLSEVVLTAFDSDRRTSGVTYIRYVDDIWFFAKNEKDLRVELVRMDLICKKIGLFPQSSKINIRRVKDIETELKSVSGIFENVSDFDSDNYFDFLIKITPLYRINDISKFRYCVTMADPTAQLINRLWNIFNNHPEIYPQLCSTIIRSNKLIASSRKNIEKILTQKTPYINIQASFIEVLCKLPLSQNDAQLFSSIVKKRFGTGSIFRNSDARLTAIVFEFLYKNNRLTQRQIEFISTSPFWYTRREISRFLNNADSLILKNNLKDPIQDVQIAAASNIVQRDIQIPSTSLPTLPTSYFKQFGLITGGIKDPCKINLTLSSMIGQKVNINWHQLLNSEYKHALKIIVSCRASYSTNASAWICELDVFNEIIVRSLFRYDTAIGKFGSPYGGILHTPKSRFAFKYKNIYDACKLINDRRITTVTAHAYNQKTNVPTKKFKHKEISFYLKEEKKILAELSKMQI